MTKQTVSGLIAAVIGMTALALPAAATTMPKVDVQGGRHNFAFGIGGPSASIDFGLTNQFSLGASASLSYLWRRTSTTWYVPRMDVRGVYQFVEGGNHGLSVGAIFGVVGDPSQAFGVGDWGPELGIGLSYPFTSTITGRLNVVGGWGGRLFAAPASGLELAFRLLPTMELAIAANGNGDLLGLRFTF
jgi:hypothetical protein